MSRSSHQLVAQQSALNAKFNLQGAARRRAMLPLAAFALVAWWGGSSYAMDIVAIEEHWEFQVGEPDDGSNGPQVCMVMSPTGDLDSDYFMFTLNHRSHPEYSPGAMQVQRWCGDDVVDTREGSASGLLTHNDEVVTWVQRTKISYGYLSFKVYNGTSTSWGSFGAYSQLRLRFPTHLTNLNGYRPATSLGESGVSFGGNRVRSLTLTKIKWWDSLGNEYELNAPIDIDADLDP